MPGRSDGVPVDRSSARSGKFRPKSPAVSAAVEYRPQAVHRLDGRGRGGHDQDVLAPLLAAVALAGTPALNPQHLPRLPARGLAETTPRGVLLQTLRGRPIGVLPGLHVAEPRATHGLLLQDERAQKLAYDPSARRLRPVFPMPTSYSPGCRMVDARVRQRLVVCGRRIVVDVVVRPDTSPRRRVVAGPRRGLGRWTWAEFSPSGTSILAQWSGECESPSAYLIAERRIRPYGGSDTVESVGLGWLRDGRAVVSFWSGVCGTGIATPGVYAVPRRGRPERLMRFSGRLAPQLAMWGG